MGVRSTKLWITDREKEIPSPEKPASSISQHRRLVCASIGRASSSVFRNKNCSETEINACRRLQNDNKSKANAPAMSYPVLLLQLSYHASCVHEVDQPESHANEARPTKASHSDGRRCGVWCRTNSAPRREYPRKTVYIPRRAKAYSRHVENTDGLGFRAQIHIKGERENTPSYAKRRTGCE